MYYYKYYSTLDNFVDINVLNIKPIYLTTHSKSWVIAKLIQLTINHSFPQYLLHLLQACFPYNNLSSCKQLHNSFNNMHQNIWLSFLSISSISIEIFNVIIPQVLPILSKNVSNPSTFLLSIVAMSVYCSKNDSWANASLQTAVDTVLGG